MFVNSMSVFTKESILKRNYVLFNNYSAISLHNGGNRTLKMFLPRINVPVISVSTIL